MKEELSLKRCASKKHFRTNYGRLFELFSSSHFSDVSMVIIGFGVVFIYVIALLGKIDKVENRVSYIFFLLGQKVRNFLPIRTQNLVQLCFRHDAERFLFQHETENGDFKNIHQVHIKLVLLEILFPPRN